TPSLEFLTTVLSMTAQYLVVSQPSESTQMTEKRPAAESAVPRPAPPATGRITSAPCEASWSDCCLPLSCLTKSSVNRPSWVSLFHPSPCTFLPLVVL